MHIDDLIILLSLSSASLNKWDQTLIYSFSDQVHRGTAFTEKQATIAIKILKSHSSSISLKLGKDISPYLNNPTFRMPLRKLSMHRKISVIDHEVHNRAIKVEFPYNEKYVEHIRKKKEELGIAQWSKEDKAWIFSLCESNIAFLVDFMSKESFEIDEEFLNYLNQYNEIVSNMEKYVPMLVREDGILKFKNISKSIPELSTQNLLEAIFTARKYGIDTWDSAIQDEMTELNINQTVQDFIGSPPGTNFQVDSEIFDINSISDIIKNLLPTLVVIPGGSETDKTRLAYNFLKNIGLADEEMSVMFRLPTVSHKDFNDFVKENNLNSPISEKTKAVFVSSKLPKPVLKSKIKFNSVINLGFGGVHYTMKEYVGKHENLIFYTEKKSQKEMNFVYM